MYVYGFRIYFTPLTGVLFAFPSRYWFTIGQSVVFSLGGWSPLVRRQFNQDFSGPDLLDFTTKEPSNTGLSPTTATLSRVFF